MRTRQCPASSRPGGAALASGRLSRRVDGWLRQWELRAAAGAGGELERGRAATPSETFPRFRQDAALGSFQSALTALGAFQGCSLRLEKPRLVVRDSSSGSSPGRARLPRDGEEDHCCPAVPHASLLFPPLAKEKGRQLKLDFRYTTVFFFSICLIAIFKTNIKKII
jgi:hypothetical protein